MSFSRKRPRTARTVFLFDIDAECAPREFVAYILRDIGITPAQTSSEMHEQLTDALVKENRAGRKFVVVIDEAQNLSDAVLERVRLLTNFETSRASLCKLSSQGSRSCPTGCLRIRWSSFDSAYRRSAASSRSRPRKLSRTSITG